MSKPKKIVLIGMRGSGKSHFGTCLSAQLGWAKMDTDHILEEEYSMTIPAMIQKEGWEYFRNAEKNLIEKISNFENVVICTGGGAILDEKNRELLKQNSLVVFLFATHADLVERIQNDTNRPALLPGKTLEEEVLEIWHTRKNLYISMADITFRPRKSLDENSRKNVEKNSEILLRKIQEFL